MNPFEHLSKELLKQATDNSPNYPEDVKATLKAVIDAARTPEELVTGILAFFATNARW